jgi:HEAT repeat protein
MAEELRRHAVRLCERAIPKELKSGDPKRILATLQMAAAWERALPTLSIGGLLDAADRKVRLQVLGLTYLLPDSPGLRRGILDALSDPDQEIASSAARAAGRLHMEEALPGLARCLRLGNALLARSAAAALADIPPMGWRILEEFKTGSNQVSALAASEALDRARGVA